VDFFTVLSNEAWYEDSVEMDHMVAFSRLAALSSGRAVARATNSGASVVLGPDGRLLAELAPGGKRRMARGTLACRVPIPEAPRALTPWVRTAGLQPWLWLLPGLLGALALRRPSRRAAA
jgi:apolipoprotein N-acyltransferase